MSVEKNNAENFGHLLVSSIQPICIVVQGGFSQIPFQLLLGVKGATLVNIYEYVLMRQLF